METREGRIIWKIPYRNNIAGKLCHGRASRDLLWLGRRVGAVYVGVRYVTDWTGLAGEVSHGASDFGELGCGKASLVVAV